jgi:hypothetical protein
LLRGKVTVTGADVLKLASSRVDDLHIAGKILVSIDFGEVAKSLICNLRDVKLVVANGQQVVIDVFEDDVRDVAIGGCCIT